MRETYIEFLFNFNVASVEERQLADQLVLSEDSRSILDFISNRYCEKC